MEYTPYFINHPEEFEPYQFDPLNPQKPQIPKANATKEGLQSLYRFEVECEDELIVHNPTEMCKRMVEKFKSSNCYKYKTETERQEIIDYLFNHPELN